MKKPSKLHPRNKNNDRYDMEALILKKPMLKEHVSKNEYGNLTINFHDPVAVKLLNQAILAQNYGIENWDFPKENLCPPIPGRADYLHYLADLLKENDEIPKGENVRILDIGCGANCIYPILGAAEYDWNFVASDTDQESVRIANDIVASNPSLKGKIECVVQPDSTVFFENIIKENDQFYATMCNPPFHSTAEDARKSSARKVSNLTRKYTEKATLNFSGNTAELVYPGGEYNFINSMIYDSKAYAKNVRWFTSLVSKGENLFGLYTQLGKVEVAEHKVIEMGTGNKVTRILAWRF